MSKTPTVEDYPPLKEWLTKHNATCLWITADRDRHSPKFIEAWLVGQAITLVVLYPNDRGWDLYTAANTTDISETLADAERRCGLHKETQL